MSKSSKESNSEVQLWTLFGSQSNAGSLISSLKSFAVQNVCLRFGMLTCVYDVFLIHSHFSWSVLWLCWQLHLSVWQRGYEFFLQQHHCWGLSFPRTTHRVLHCFWYHKSNKAATTDELVRADKVFCLAGYVSSMLLLRACLILMRVKQDLV